MLFENRWEEGQKIMLLIMFYLSGGIMIFFLEYQLEIKQNIFCCLKVESKREKEEDIMVLGGCLLNKWS